MLATCLTLYPPLSVVTAVLCKPADTIPPEDGDCSMPGQPVLTGENTMCPLRAGRKDVSYA
jgi:hypothetical protein